MLTAIVLGFLLSRNATIVGDHVVWTCVYQVGGEHVTVQQKDNCEQVKEVK